MTSSNVFGRLGVCLSWRTALVLAGALLCTAAQALTLTGVQSRKVHGSEGVREIALTRGVGVSGAVTVEPRAIGSGHVIVFQFDQPVTLGPAHNFDLTNETGTSLIGQPGIGMSVALVPAASSEVAATLTGIGDNRRVTVWLNDIVGADLVSQNVRVSVGFLLGDSNASQKVDATDVSRVKARAGLGAAQGGAQHDFNASGVISSADIAAVKAGNNRSLVPGNIAPVVSAGGNQSVTLPAPAALNGSVSDDGFPSPPAAVTVAWSAVAGPAAVAFGNAAVAQTTATFSQPGAYTLRLTASDGQLSSSADALITVNTLVATPQIGNLPFSVTAGATTSATVTIRDALSNVVTGYTGTVRFSSSDPLAILPSDYAFTPGDAGVKTFNLQLRSAGSRSVTVTDASSNLFSTALTTVQPGSAAALQFLQQPTGGSVRSNVTPAVQVAVNDAFGNRVFASQSISVSLGMNPGSAALSGTIVQTTSSGVATFNDLSLNNEGAGFTLLATATGLPSATSSTFTIMDNIAPGAIADLFADNATQSSLSLSWSATGDDGTLGDLPAASYMLKVHTAPISALNFDTVGTVVPTGAPAAPGMPESVTASGLNADTLYYFGLRVADGAGNQSFAFASNSTLPCNEGYTGATCSQCANGYVSNMGVCVAICVASNPCTAPPPAFCVSSTTLTTYDSPGVCASAASSPYYSCSYSQSQMTDCSLLGQVCSTVAGVAACRTP